MYFTYDTNFDGTKGVYHFKTLIPIGKFINLNQKQSLMLINTDLKNLIFKTFKVKIR